MNKSNLNLTAITTKSGDTVVISRLCTPQTIDDVINYKFDNNDVIVVTFPKSGTTWMNNILSLIVRKGEPLPNGIGIQEFSPFAEAVGRGVLLRQRTDDVMPRCYHSHLPKHVFSGLNGAKVVCVLRHPKDVCVSYFHHVMVWKDLYKFDGNFDNFFDIFLSGGDNRDYFDHVKGWMTYFENPNCFHVLYEDMVTNTETVITSLSRFLGYEDHVTDPCVKEKILKRCCFKYMKSNMQKFTNRIVDGKCAVIRKGVIGDWKNHMSDEQSKIIDEKCRNHGIDHLWKNYKHLF